MPHGTLELLAPPQPGVISPLPETNEADGLGVVSSRSLASRIYDAHRAALQARRSRDLISENCSCI